MTKENCEDLERVQKSSSKIIFGQEYKNDYETALIKADLESLKERRKRLCAVFAKKCLKSEKSRNMFPKRKKIHEMEVRGEEY